MVANPLMIGVDAGGTRTRACAFDVAWNELGRAEGGAANPHSVGFDAAIDALHSAIHRCASPRPVGLIGIGLAGGANPETRERVRTALTTRWPGSSIHITTDAALALECAAEQLGGVAIALIAGTGSIALARDARGEVHRAGGCGFRLGDEGSAAWIAKRAIVAAQRSIDGRQEATSLTANLLHALAVSTPAELIEAAHRAAERADSLAALAPIVSRCAEDGDAAANAILIDAGAELAALVIAVAQRASIERGEYLVSGGVLANSRQVRESLLERLARSAPGLVSIERRRTPERAAVELAQLALGRTGASP